MWYPVETVAKYIINRCHNNGKAISNLKLQKILYFVQAEFLVSLGEPCFDEQIEAWDFGPVVPEVYDRYRVYGGASIPYLEGSEYCPFNKKEKILADEMIDECAEYSAASLVKITQKQTPWKDVYGKKGSSIISNESIKNFFNDEHCSNPISSWTIIYTKVKRLIEYINNKNRKRNNMKMNQSKNKDSKLVFEPVMWRKLLQKNPVMKDKYCRYCGKSLDDNCECPKIVAEIIDCKPYRDENGVNSNTRSVMVFRNTPEFQEAYEQIIEEIKAKKNAEFDNEVEVELCFD